MDECSRYSAGLLIRDVLNYHNLKNTAAVMQ